MHHPIQFEIRAKNIQKDRLRAAQASRLAGQSRPVPARFLTRSFKLVSAVQNFLMTPIRSMRNLAQKTADLKHYKQEVANRQS